MSTAPDTSEYMAVDDAADLLGLNPRQVHRYAVDGKLRALHVGKRRLVHRGDVEALHREREAVKPVTPKPPAATCARWALTSY